MCPGMLGRQLFKWTKTSAVVNKFTERKIRTGAHPFVIHFVVCISGPLITWTYPGLICRSFPLSAADSFSRQKTAAMLASVRADLLRWRIKSLINNKTLRVRFRSRDMCGWRDRHGFMGNFQFVSAVIRFIGDCVVCSLLGDKRDQSGMFFTRSQLYYYFCCNCIIELFVVKEKLYLVIIALLKLY